MNEVPPSNSSPQSRMDHRAARLALLAREKELTRLRDELAAARRALPPVPVENFIFDGPSGTVTLADLFAGRRQLIVYHFMFAPNWREGCKSCSFWVEHFDAAAIFLRQRDTSLAVVSRASVATIEPFKARMGWRFPWVSSARSTFSRDFAVSFFGEPGEEYNFQPHRRGAGEMPGLSVFRRGAEGAILHTYSCYARGLDALNPTYQLLDLTPLGRAEDGLPWPMAWVRYKDQAETSPAA